MIAAETNLIASFIVVASAAVLALLDPPAPENDTHPCLRTWFQLGLFVGFVAMLTAIACDLVTP